MTVYGEVTYVFYLPQDYDEMKQFEAENDLSIYRRTEDTIAVRYSHKVNATYPYKSKADRKTENSSEKPNNCEDLQDWKDRMWAEAIVTEPTISKMEQVDEPQTYCGDFADRLAYERGVKHAWEVAQKVFNSTVTFYEAEDVAKQIDKDINVRSKDKPQTDWHYDEQDATWYPYKHEDEPQTDKPCSNCQEFDCYGCEHKQTDCAWK